MKLANAFLAGLVAAMGVGEIRAADPDEFSSRFWVRFADLPATVQPGERYKVNAAEDGCLVLTLFAKETDSFGDLKIESKAKVKPGEWHLVAFSYSLQQMRAAFFVDGALQWENGVTPIPALDSKGRRYREKNVAEVREYTEFPFAAEAEELDFASLDEVRAMKAKAELLGGRLEATAAPEALKKTGRERVSNFSFFEKETAKTPYGTFTVRRLKETLALIEKILRMATAWRPKAAGRAADADALVPARKPFDPKRFRLMCYNIRVGAGAETWNGPYKPGELRSLPRVARTIAEAGADIACLQEVNQLAEATGGVDQPAYLAEKTGLVATYREKVPRGQGSYGLAMLSPAKPVATRKIALPKGKDHIRICLVNEFADFVVATAHFSGDKDAQLRSVGLLVKELSAYQKPVFFCGDLNAEPDSETVAKLKEHFTLLSDPSVPTCHALHPDACLDYLFVDTAHAGDVKATGFTVGASTASDHLPLWVDLTLR